LPHLAVLRFRAWMCSAKNRNLFNATVAITAVLTYWYNQTYNHCYVYTTRTVQLELLTAGQ